MEPIAISVIAYNRIDSLSRLLESLSNAFYDGDEVPLYISIDKSDTDKVEKFADAFGWQYGRKTVVRHKENLGLRRHVLEQGKWLSDHEALVVLEDDLVVAPDFWNYTRQTVKKYSSSDDIAGISLYSFAVNYHLRHPFSPIYDGNDVCFMNCAMSWGQIWMRRQWHDFSEWYQRNMEWTPNPELPKSICSWSDKSWLKYHTRYCIENNRYFVYPYISYTTNCGDAGTHMKEADNIFQVALLQGRIGKLRLPDFSDGCVRYDGFFENKALYSSLGIDEKDCCLDLNNTNGNRTGRRYWLTTRRLPYKVVRSFSYARRPMEVNVLQGIEGQGIYLYDTMCPAQLPSAKGNPSFLASHFIQNSFLFLREYGFRNFLHDFLILVKQKL